MDGLTQFFGEDESARAFINVSTFCSMVELFVLLVSSTDFLVRLETTTGLFVRGDFGDIDL